MDPVTAAIVSAVSAGLSTIGKEAVKDAYNHIKNVIKEKLGNVKAIDALEKKPDSKELQEALAENLAARHVEKDLELLSLAARLAEALRETEAGREEASRYHVEAAAAQTQILIGDGAYIEGGIHFGHYHASTPPPVEMPTPASGSGIPAELNIEADIDTYCRSAEALYENLPLVGFRTRLRVPIRIEDIYIPLRAMMDPRATGFSCFTDADDADRKTGACDEIALPEAFQRAEEMKQRGIVILGDPGSGKTTHLKRLLLWCLRKGPGDLGLPEGIIPVFLPLRELKNLERGLDVFIEGQLDKPHLRTPEGFGERLLKRGNLLLLLDGLDEVADAGQRVRVSQWINEAVRMHRSCRFVVTCRFAGYTREAQLSEDFLQMHIRPLSQEEMRAFVRNWYSIVEGALNKDKGQAGVLAENNSKDLIERLEKPEFRSRRVFELTRNPLLLTNICLVHKDRGNLPHNRVRLYEECTDVLLELWRAAIGYDTKIDARSGRKVLQPAALWLHGEEGRTRAGAAELKPVIEPVLRAVGWPHGNAEEFLRVVRDESGLLTGWDQDQYGFMHLGFQEFLVAREIQNTYHRNPMVLSDLADRFGESWWQEVTLLLLALDNPCLFEQFMRSLVRKASFTKYPELVEMCIDDAVERPLAPFLEVLKAEPGKDPEHWNRQLAVLTLVERLDNTVLNGLIQKLAQHPYEKIRERVGQRAYRAEQKADRKIIAAPRGGYELVLISGGQFLMGSPKKEKGHNSDEEPQRRVLVSDFYMGRYPVTNEEYARFLAENPKAGEPSFWSDRKYNQSRQPVVGVSWVDAMRYAEWAGLQLPSEAQWEYACRAGSLTAYSSGDNIEDLKRMGWYEGNSGGRLHPVGEKEPNRFGLYDMHGNVWEWVEDEWHGSYEGAPDDGSSWINDPRSSYRVVRGGCWFSPAEGCRSAYRFRFGPVIRNGFLGFRLVLPPGQQG
jgi:formylglycine-generating enzyme required for sulfatase activity